jgi:hypothetical protein
MTSRKCAAYERPAFIRPVGSLLLVLGLLATIACGGDSGGDKTTGPTATVEGNYNLRSVEGNRLPVEVYHGPWFDGVNKRFYNQMILVVKNGVINLDDTDRWAMTLDVQMTLDAVTTQQTLAIMGSYEIDGEEILFSSFDDDTELAGTIKKGTISLSMDVGGSEREKAYSFTR